MSVTAGLPELLTYSDHERAKWRAWVEADPSRLALPFQAGARFKTIGTCSTTSSWSSAGTCRGSRAPRRRTRPACPRATSRRCSSTRDLVRADFRRFVTSLDDAAAAQPLTFTLPAAGTFTMTRRKLATNIVLHEVRHLAQVAHAARAAGVEPPGEHDLLFCPDYD